MEGASMRTTFKKTSPTFRPGVVNKGQLGVAAVLLLGVIVLGYGYFQHSRAGSYVGLAVILVGVLNGVIQILVRDNR